MNVMQVLVRLTAFVALALAVAAVFTASALATGDVGKCNSGRGNGSEGDPSQLISPGTGSVGISPTVDCDPGNSGDVNKGGD